MSWCNSKLRYSHGWNLTTPWFSRYLKKETKTRIIKYPNPTCFSCFLGEIVWNRTCLVVKSIEILLPACFLVPPLLLVTLKLCPPPMWLCLRYARMRPLGSIAPALFTMRKNVGTLCQEKISTFLSWKCVKKCQTFFAKKFAPPFKKHTHPWSDHVSRWDLVINSSRIMASSTLLRDRLNRLFPVVDRQISPFLLPESSQVSM